MSQFPKSSSLLTSCLTLKWAISKVLITSDFVLDFEILKWASFQSAHHFWLHVWLQNFKMSQFSKCSSLLTSYLTPKLWNEAVLKVLITSNFVSDFEMSQFSKYSSFLTSCLTLKLWDEPVLKVLITFDFVSVFETFKWANFQSAHHFWHRVRLWNFEMSQFSKCSSLLTSCLTSKLWNESLLKVLITSDFVFDSETLKRATSQSVHHFWHHVGCLINFENCLQNIWTNRVPVSTRVRRWGEQGCSDSKSRRLAGRAWCFDLKTDFWFKDSKNAGLNRD